MFTKADKQFFQSKTTTVWSQLITKRSKQVNKKTWKSFIKSLCPFKPLLKTCPLKQQPGSLSVHRVGNGSADDVSLLKPHYALTTLQAFLSRADWQLLLPAACDPPKSKSGYSITYVKSKGNEVLVQFCPTKFHYFQGSYWSVTR